MPVVPLEIGSHIKTEKWLMVQALVDSGADATMIPVRYLRQLGAVPVNKRRVVDARGISYQVEVYVVALRVGPYQHPAVEILANRQSHDVLLGRNILTGRQDVAVNSRGQRCGVDHAVWCFREPIPDWHTLQQPG